APADRADAGHRAGAPDAARDQHRDDRRDRRARPGHRRARALHRGRAGGLAARRRRPHPLRTRRRPRAGGADRGAGTGRPRPGGPAVARTGTIEWRFSPDTPDPGPASSMLTFQQMILRLQAYWDQRGCALLQPYDMEVGAGTFHTATFLRAIG